MSTEYYIIDEPKPLSLDFASLKNEGLAYIREHINSEWTNLNPSDPGITILDQLCYALTELGYCNDFPIKDILTDKNGNLQIKDQFYLPENILTTSPITHDDLRKWIIDSVKGIDNLIIVPIVNASGMGVSQIYLSINSSITGNIEKHDICKAAFFAANRARNLGEIFLMPLPLVTSKRLLQGMIVIDNNHDTISVLSAIQQAMDEYIFPKIVISGYDRLAETGITPDEIFNGPLLANGWIPDSALGIFRSKLRTAELVQVITSVPGVLSASNILFTTADANGLYNTASDTFPNILSIDILASVSPGVEKNDGQGCLSIYANGRQIEATSLPLALLPAYTAPSPNILYGASVATQTKVPVGKFRDINTYYSIQHTFPEIFKVGENAVVAGASDVQIGQSRQLKGYLTLFDQVLANQFSQLAGLGQLFSFKNATTAAYEDRHNYYVTKDADELAHPKYPVPFRNFAPTYFYQSVYDIPNVSPLLKNNYVFDFGYDPDETAADLANESWIDYQRDPYNAYMKGLMDVMENEKVNLVRRNEILDHLLARHGESPIMIDTLIEGSVYTGEKAKDKIIFKSLYLQNLGLLSYYRAKAHDYMSARRISANLAEVQIGFEERILGWDAQDFIINTDKIDLVEKLKQQDFADYAAVELKLCLLFGLKALYKNYIADLFSSDQTDSDDIRIAMWLITQRRGFIFIETNLLNHHVSANDQSGESPMLLAADELILIFPSFMPAFGTAAFSNRLKLFLNNEMPVRLSCQYYFADTAQLLKIIPAYADWHNCLVYNSPDHSFNKWLIKSAGSLIQLLKPMIASHA